jgi:hypothetical protein
MRGLLSDEKVSVGAVQRSPRAPSFLQRSVTHSVRSVNTRVYLKLQTIGPSSYLPLSYERFEILCHSTAALNIISTRWTIRNEELADRYEFHGFSSESLDNVSLIRSTYRTSGCSQALCSIVAISILTSPVRRCCYLGGFPGVTPRKPSAV